MRVIVPSELDLESTSIAASTLAEWSSQGTYAIGNEVKVTSATPHYEYRALQASGGGLPSRAPASYPEYWHKIGATNQWRLLDDSATTQTRDTTSIEAVVSVEGNITHLAFVGMEGVRLIEAVGTANGSERFAETRTPSIAAPVSSWSDWFFNLPRFQSSLVVPVAGFWSAGEITITLTGDSGEDVAIGHVVAGVGLDLGATLYGPELELSSASKKSTDEFGIATLVQRPSSYVGSMKVLVNRADFDFVADTLQRLDALPAMWDFNNDDEGGYDALRLYGFFQDFALLIPGWDEHYCELRVEALT